MPTTPLSPPIAPPRTSASTDQASSETGWASATGTITIRRPEPPGTDSSSGDASFIEQRGTDAPSLGTL